MLMIFHNVVLCILYNYLCINVVIIRSGDDSVKFIGKYNLEFGLLSYVALSLIMLVEGITINLFTWSLHQGNVVWL